MKPFFKAVLLIKHTQNKDGVDFESLKQLAEEKNLIKDDNGMILQLAEQILNLTNTNEIKQDQIHFQFFNVHRILKSILKKMIEAKFSNKTFKLFISQYFYLKSEFEEIITRFDDLCVALIKQNPPQVEDFNELLTNYGFDDEKNQKELLQVWEHEKEQAFSYLIKKNGNFRKLDKIEWSLNNKFYTKKAKNLNEMTAVCSLKISEYNSKNQKHITFEMNNQELQQLRDDLQRIEDEIIGLTGQQQ